jgi:hypothetical protein
MGTQHDEYQNTGKFDALADLESPEFKVPVICLATGCVSSRRERRYPPCYGPYILSVTTT